MSRQEIKAKKSTLDNNITLHVLVKKDACSFFNKNLPTLPLPPSPVSALLRVSSLLVSLCPCSSIYAVSCEPRVLGTVVYFDFGLASVARP